MPEREGGHTVNLALLEQKLEAVASEAKQATLTLRGQGKEGGLIELVNQNALAIEKLRGALSKVVWIVVGTLLGVLGTILEKMLK